MEVISSDATDEASVSGDDGFVTPVIESPEIQVKVRVFRYDPLSDERGHDEWACVLAGNTSILDLLRTIKSTEDGSLTFRDGSLDDPTTAICANGRPILPGLTRIDSILSSNSDLNLNSTSKSNNPQLVMRKAEEWSSNFSYSSVVAS